MEGCLSTIIHRPVEDVFGFVAVNYFENRSKWARSILELQKTSNGPMGVGTTGKELSSYGGPQFEAILVVTEFIPDTRLVVEDSFYYARHQPRISVIREDPTKVRQFTRTYAFEPVQTGTRVTFCTDDHKVAIGIDKPLMALNRFWSTNSSKETMDKLKDLLEGPSKSRAIISFMRRVFTFRIISLVLFLASLILYICAHTLHITATLRDALDIVALTLFVVVAILSPLYTAFFRRMTR